MGQCFAALKRPLDPFGCLQGLRERVVASLLVARLRLSEPDLGQYLGPRQACLDDRRIPERLCKGVGGSRAIAEAGLATADDGARLGTVPGCSDHGARLYR